MVGQGDLETHKTDHGRLRSWLAPDAMCKEVLRVGNIARFAELCLQSRRSFLGPVTLHLQAHHRPSHEPMLDSSGVNLQVTSAMRPNDAVFLTAGAVFGFAIPPAQRRFRLRFANRAVFHAPIRIFSIFSHTHGDGVALTAWLLRQGTVLAQIGRSSASHHY